MNGLLRGMALISLLLSGAIFGFFYAWVCSTMWGLDRLEPGTAIAAMQAMNASVRNGVFAPAFFGTPFVLLATALGGWRAREGLSAGLFGLAGVISLFGGVVLTMAVNVPMNEALAQVALPLPDGLAEQVWAEYSPDWQLWNTIRTVATGIVLLLVGVALMRLPRSTDAAPA